MSDSSPQTNRGIPSIPEPAADVMPLARSVRALKQAVEVLLGRRGDPVAAAYTRQDALEAIALPRPVAGYTIARLPRAADYPRCIVYVIDPAANKHMAVSDGTAWRYMDGTLV